MSETRSIQGLTELEIRREVYDKLEVYRLSNSAIPVQDAIHRQQCVDFLVAMILSRRAIEADLYAELLMAHAIYLEREAHYGSHAPHVAAYWRQKAESAAAALRKARGEA